MGVNSVGKGFGDLIVVVEILLEEMKMKLGVIEDGALNEICVHILWGIKVKEWLSQVTSLNLEIVRDLARDGISSVRMYPFVSGWTTCKKKRNELQIKLCILRCVSAKCHLFVLYKNFGF
ncbi:hypothetical protein C5167_030858 [Papaver somniferum]|nr:hypothetical protein C5167_030858 [Papaver somniferum]